MNTYYIYESRLPSSYADQDTHMEYDQMRFIFQNTPSLTIHSLLLSVLQYLDPIGQKDSCRYNVLMNFPAHPRTRVFDDIMTGKFEP